jgi:hypothetical protein
MAMLRANKNAKPDRPATKVTVTALIFLEAMAPKKSAKNYGQHF